MCKNCAKNDLYVLIIVQEEKKKPVMIDGALKGSEEIEGTKKKKN